MNTSELARSIGLACILLVGGCNADAPEPAVKASAQPAPAPTSQVQAAPFVVTEVGRFDSPWAMTFLPDGRLLVTEKAGVLKLFDPANGNTGHISGVPAVVNRGQGGFGDVVLHPDYANNQLIYLSYVEEGDGGTGTAVIRAKLAIDTDGNGALQDIERVWTQSPKVSGNGHFAQRLAFAPDGMLFITSGERQRFDPAQDMSGNLGKLIRLHDDGRLPDDNPFADHGDIAAQIWSLGHRNSLGLAFTADGTLWAHEMGPQGGDELNRIERGANYGYPIVSDGDHYGGADIPDHITRPEFNAPEVTWTPVIAPAGMVIYSGALFPEWRGNAFIGGLASMALVRVELTADTAREVERFAMGRRIREVEQGPDGALWLLEDGAGALLKVTPGE